MIAPLPKLLLRAQHAWRKVSLRWFVSRFVTLALLTTLSACSNQPPTTEWKLHSSSYLNAAEQAYLLGDQSREKYALDSARLEISKTADPVRLANLELRYCALRVASLDWSDCSAFIPLKAYASVEQRAYANYLNGYDLNSSQIALLPKEQQELAHFQRIQTGQINQIRIKTEPLSQLLALALIYRRSAKLDLALIQTAVQIATEQGWRRPLLAWLKTQQKYALLHNQTQLLQETLLRIQILENAGQKLSSTSMQIDISNR